MLLISENSKKTIDEYSQQFLRDFVNLLRTTHGEKKVHVNQFYQQVIQDKTHIHMNSTRWTSLTQFALHLGREGICRVEEKDKDLFISWIDNSPETLRRREALLKKERQDKGDEEREQKQILEQVQRAQQKVEAAEEQQVQEAKLLQRKEGEKVKLNFGVSKQTAGEKKSESESPREESPKDSESTTATLVSDASTPALPSSQSAPKPGVKLSMSLGEKKPKNVFAAAMKSNPLAAKKTVVAEPPKKMTEQERIMKAEMEAMERKRLHSQSSGGPFHGAKRQRVS
jgi:DNA/RNA-binding protein KIN17